VLLSIGDRLRDERLATKAMASSAVTRAIGLATIRKPGSRSVGMRVDDRIRPEAFAHRRLAARLLVHRSSSRAVLYRSPGLLLPDNTGHATRPADRR